MTPVFVCAQTNHVPVQRDKLIELRSGGSFNFINPLLDCYSQKPTTAVTYKQLEAKLKTYVKNAALNGEISSASVYYRNLNAGDWVGVNENEVYSPASLLKVPFMIAAFKYAENNPDFLNTYITYSPTDETKLQSISSGFTLQAGNTYSMEEYIQSMIIESNNDAKNVVVSNIPYYDYLEIFKVLGIDIMKYDSITNATNFITVREYASFFRLLYNSSYLSREFSEYALDILSHTLFKDGIRAGVPNIVKVSNKFGERFNYGSSKRQIHDCGIVYLPNNPYILCVMTKGTNFDNMKKAIADISRITYEHFTTKTSINK